MVLKRALLKRLLLNFLFLLLSLGIAAGCTWLVGIYFQKNPSYSAEGAGWGGVGDALSVAFAGTVFLILSLVIWSIRVFNDMARYKQSLLFFTCNLAMIVLAFSFFILVLLRILN